MSNTISLKDYAAWTIQTAKYLEGVYTPSVHYPTDEIVNEIGELVEGFLLGSSSTEILKELGDVFYGLARTCEDAGLNFHEVFYLLDIEEDKDLYAVADDIFTQLLISASKIKGVTKKMGRDGGGELTVERKDKLVNALAILCRDLRVLMSDLGVTGVTAEQVAYINQQKLMSRKERGVLGGDGDNR